MCCHSAELQRRLEGLKVMKYLLRGSVPSLIEAYLYETIDVLSDDYYSHAHTHLLLRAVLRLLHQILRIGVSDEFTSRVSYHIFKLLVTLHHHVESLTVAASIRSTLSGIIERCLTLFMKRVHALPNPPLLTYDIITTSLTLYKPAEPRYDAARGLIYDASSPSASSSSSTTTGTTHITDATTQKQSSDELSRLLQQVIDAKGSLAIA
jgi:hypothetical protein